MTTHPSKKTNGRYMRVRERSTGKTALGVKGEHGTVWVQFNDLSHPQSHNWHLHPRSRFHRLRGHA